MTEKAGTLGYVSSVAKTKGIQTEDFMSRFRITFKEPDQLVVPIDYVVRNVTWEVRDGTDMMYGVEDPAIMNTIDVEASSKEEAIKIAKESVEAETEESPDPADYYDEQTAVTLAIEKLEPEVEDVQVL
tara:strand:+ start:333 stop:719 length:387 start_codon:yes stop_codon:yes gene_type:complete